MKIEKTHKNVTIPVELLIKVKQACLDHNMKINEIVGKAIEIYLKKLGSKTGRSL